MPTVQERLPSIRDQFFDLDLDSPLRGRATRQDGRARVLLPALIEPDVLAAVAKRVLGLQQYTLPRTTRISKPHCENYNAFKLAGFYTMLAELSSLFDDLGDYNDDFLIPTDYSVTTTENVLHDACHKVVSVFPLGTVYPDGSGGLRLEWSRLDREVKLIIKSAPTGKHYLFFKRGKAYGGDYNVTADRLADYLNWLTSNDTAEP